MQAQGQLFAGDLCSDHAHGQIGDLVLRVEPGAFGHGFGQPAAQFGDAVALFGGDHEGLDEGVAVVHVLRQGQQDRGFDAVDLVYGKGDGAALRQILEPLEDLFDAFGNAAVGLYQQDDDVGVGGAAPGGGDHGAVE